MRTTERKVAQRSEEVHGSNPRHRKEQNGVKGLRGPDEEEGGFHNGRSDQGNERNDEEEGAGTCDLIGGTNFPSSFNGFDSFTCLLHPIPMSDEMLTDIRMYSCRKKMMMIP